MKPKRSRAFEILAAVFTFTLASWAMAQESHTQVGREVSIPAHLQDGDEFTTPLRRLIEYGSQLFSAKFTVQEGAGRPLTKGTGTPISDSSSPLVFPRNFSRLSAPDANACSGCHNTPNVGGGGDRVTEVFVLGQRFDHLTFDHADGIPMRGALDESGKFVTMNDVANERKTIGMNGSGFIEMLARQMTADLEAIRDSTPPGGTRSLMSKGVYFGTIHRNPDGTWDTSHVQGISPVSLVSTGPNNPPTLAIAPLAQGSNVISLRQFTNNAMNQHHGMQSEERFGLNTEPDGDGVANELTVADVTAISVFQAVLSVPGQVVPRDTATERAVLRGQQLFDQVGCNTCHMDALPLTNHGWVYSEPGPYNPAGNLRPGPVNYPLTAPQLAVDLTNDELPQPRLHVVNGVVMVPAYTDLKMHDISARSDPAIDPECEPLNQNYPAGSTEFFVGNCQFITRKLWGFYNQGGPFMHHGKFTTAREAVEAHNGEAIASRKAFDSLTAEQRDDIVEFLKSLQVLPAGSRSLVVDENGNPRPWPPNGDLVMQKR